MTKRENLRLLACIASGEGVELTATTNQNGTVTVRRSEEYTRTVTRTYVTKKRGK